MKKVIQLSRRGQRESVSSFSASSSGFPFLGGLRVHLIELNKIIIRFVASSYFE